LPLPGLAAAGDIENVSGLMRLADEIQRQAMMIGCINSFSMLALSAAIVSAPSR
jgi:hypothetical protein